MAFRRTLLKQFSLANSAYIAASVAFYRVDPDTKERTDTLATLYAGISGVAQVANPYTLDGNGKFATPVYIEEPVVGVINESDLGTHETGIVSPQSSGWRGDWSAEESYLPGELVRDGSEGLNTLNIYSCEVEHVSGVWADDLGAGRWTLIIDVQQVSSDAADAAASASAASTSASNAASSASAASSSASAASTSASNAATSESNASSSASAASSSASSASSSASSASTSASNASTSASNASTSATNASNSASAAAASAVVAAKRTSVAESGSQTFALADADTYQRYTGGGGHTWTIPANASVAFDTDSEIDGFNATANDLTLTAASGVTINGVTAGSIVVPPYTGFNLKKVATNTWDHSGFNADSWA